MFLICPADPPRILDMSAKDSRPIDRREDISPPVLPLGSMIITTTIVQQNILSYDNSCNMRNELCPECDGGNEMHISVL
jgi:hypothetical protein